MDHGREMWPWFGISMFMRRRVFSPAHFFFVKNFFKIFPPFSKRAVSLLHFWEKYSKRTRYVSLTESAFRHAASDASFLEKGVLHMLQIKEITKKYKTGGTEQTALDRVSLCFRDSEFVAVLGPSGSGKTTLLNILGGLDSCDGGQLLIDGISTAEYSGRDWDAYRNRRVGFVFQNYDLIPHQTVLRNVELPLTLAGVSGTERRERAKKVLGEVGMISEMRKKPSHLSGGQMQRTAIARALVGNPAVLLADEPTGALDSGTSHQILELLKQVSQKRLVVMVTHNAALAEKYATRIICLSDGKVVSDTDPFRPAPGVVSKRAAGRARSRLVFPSAFSLSLNNLRAKKSRTVITALAGSIGIFGIALILASSGGVQKYISGVETDTLSAYPICIQQKNTDMTSLVASALSGEEENDDNDDNRGSGKVYSDNIAAGMLSAVSGDTKTNDLRAFRRYLESGASDILQDVSTVQYCYDLQLQIYSSDLSNGAQKLNPGTLTGYTGLESQLSTSSGDAFQELPGDSDYLASRFDVVAGRLPSDKAPDEVVLAVNQDDSVSDLALYTIGLMDRDEYTAMQKAAEKGDTVEAPAAQSFTYGDILKTTFKLMLNTAYYRYDPDKSIWMDMRSDSDWLGDAVKKGLTLKIVGIIRPKDGSASFDGAIGYTSGLTQLVASAVRQSKIARDQLADPKTDVFTGKPFDLSLTMEDVTAYADSLSQDAKKSFYAETANLSDEEILALVESRLDTDHATYESNLKQLGVIDPETPSEIRLYPVNFHAKEKIAKIITAYNHELENAGYGQYAIGYTDLAGFLMKSISSVVKLISGVLVGFVSVSLAVSCLMTGVITYISVLERTREIGVLRALGASRRNITGIFNAETLLLGLLSGFFGVSVLYVLMPLASRVLSRLSGVTIKAGLPWTSALLLIGLSMALTLLSGLIPAGIAAGKDPAEALRAD